MSNYGCYRSFFHTGNGTVVALTTIRVDKEEDNMKAINLLRSLALSLVLGLSISVSGVSAQDDLTRGELRNLHQFLEDHPRIARDLRNNPSFINDRGWVDRHDELQNFLRDNPRIRRELREDPRRVMTWERNMNARADMRKFDRFLDAHPRLADRLRANPELLRDRKFIDNHDELQAFLRDNPDMRRELQAQPRAFMDRVGRYDRYSRR